ncbi:MAG: hypothetical protein ACJ8HI_15365 [Massilia sp.]
MNALLDAVLEAHGGLARFNRHETVSVTVLTGGALWESKGIVMDAFERRATAATSREWSSVTPFGNPGWVMNFVPERIEVLDEQQKVVAERDHPRAAFAGHGRFTPWDPMHRAYFNGYALWTYLTSPFLLALPGVAVSEVAPWLEGRDSWRVLRAVFPDSIASHSRQQDFYFDSDYLLRRHDYQVDVAGGFAAAQYIDGMHEVDGLMFPRKRRAYPRLDNGQPQREQLLVSIDLSDYALR